MKKQAVYSGKILETIVQKTLESNISLSELKITMLQSDYLKVYFIRCLPFEKLIDVLKNHADVGTLTTQHNIIKVFLNYIFGSGKLTALER